MRTDAPPLLPIFRSDVQGRLLAYLYEAPTREWTLTELSERIEAHVATIHREVSRLEAAGILRTRRIGRSRLVTTNPGWSAAKELAALVLKVFGPVRVLSKILSPIPGVEKAFIHGSWAERFLGTKGPPPNDLDVLVLGNADPDDIDRAMRQARNQVAIDVNILVRSNEAWLRAEDGFIKMVRTSPIVEIPMVQDR
jgi:DNA-binding Lrp family transcriptional regulator